MIRTRDFVLLLLTVAFLLLAIGATALTRWTGTTHQGVALQPATTSADEYAVVAENTHDFSRAQKLQAMREKIAASEELSMIAPKPEAVAEDVQATSSTSTTDTQVADTGLTLCPNYTQTRTAWSATEVEIKEAEGVRLVYKAAPNNASAATSSNPAQKDILVHLPVRSVPAGQSSCIPSDVIGIATDGSLIRNNEVGLYGIFGSNTLVGWALDGFPIYGTAAQSGDACGGVMTATGYQYQLSAQRETIINCFSAPPTHL